MSIPTQPFMLEVLSELLYKKKERIEFFEKNLEIDFGYIHSDGSSYRGNAYIYLGRVAIALRRISENVKNLGELGIPKSIKKVLQAKQGLFLVTGPTGSGKSTSMASILETINETRSSHILTIEDPIEYVFKNKKSIFAQREVGRDTHSFGNAIKSAMREDSDIIMIGEIRDAETMETALSLSETGHLVFSTLHTSGSVQTINRMTQFFPTTVEPQIRARIGESLIGVLSQRLIPTKDKKSRVAIREMMYVNSGIKNLIIKGDLAQINNTIEIGNQDGMISMRKYADMLRDQGLVDEKDYI